MNNNKPKLLLIKPEPAHRGFSPEMALTTQPLEPEYYQLVMLLFSIAEKRAFTAF